MEDLQLHHPLFIKEVLICKLIYCLCNMNFPMCSYETNGYKSWNWQFTLAIFLQHQSEMDTLQNTKIVLMT